MSMKYALYNEEDETYTDIAETLDSRVNQLLRPIYDEYNGKVSLRDLNALIQAASNDLMLETLLNNRS